MKSASYRVLWKGKITGPFSRDQVEEMLSRNDIGIWAEISEEHSNWKPISEWRIRESVFKPPQKPLGDPVKSNFSGGHEPKTSSIPETNIPDLPPLPLTEENENTSTNADETYSWQVNQQTRAHDGGFFYWALMPIRKYALFFGRARRKEYWLFTLIIAIFFGAISFAQGYLEYDPSADYEMLEFVYTIDEVAALILLLPNLAVTVRRLHDTSRSGWWILLGLTGIGLLVLLLFAMQEGSEGENEYGPDPKMA